jgi:hypothetical protein
VARALGATGNTGIVSETSTDSLEDIAEAFDGQQGMLQVGLHGPDEHVLAYAERAAAAGFRALCFTRAVGGRSGGSGSVAGPTTSTCTSVLGESVTSRRGWPTLVSC